MTRSPDDKPEHDATLFERARHRVEDAAHRLEEAARDLEERAHHLAERVEERVDHLVHRAEASAERIVDESETVAHRVVEVFAPPPAEPLGMLDFAELPEAYGVDECEVLDKDPHWVFVYWEVTDGGLARAREQLGPPGRESARLVLRLFYTGASAHGVERHLHDVDLTWNHGRRYLHVAHVGAQLRVAVGLLSPEGYFAPVAHSSLLRLPSPEPQPQASVQWMEVVPPKTREREPLVVVQRGEGERPHPERALPWSIVKSGAPGAPSSPSERKPSPGHGSGGLR